MHWKIWGLWIQSAKVACLFEDERTVLVENIVQEDCQLWSDATDYNLELKQYKETLVNNIKSHSYLFVCLRQVQWA